MLKGQTVIEHASALFVHNMWRGTAVSAVFHASLIVLAALASTSLWPTLQRNEIVVPIDLLLAMTEDSDELAGDGTDAPDRGQGRAGAERPTDASAPDRTSAPDTAPTSDTASTSDSASTSDTASTSDAASASDTGSTSDTTRTPSEKPQAADQAADQPAVPPATSGQPDQPQGAAGARAGDKGSNVASMSLPTIDFPNPDLPVRDVDVSSARASGPRPPRAIGDTGFSAEVVFESRPPAGRMRPATAAADGKDQTEPEPTKTTRRPGNDAGDGPTETAEGEPQSPAQGTGRGTPAAKVVMDGLSLRVTIAKESAEPNPEGAETSAQRKAGPGRGRPTVEKRPERSRPATPLRKLPTREPLDETQTSKTQAIHKSIPYLSLPVSPAAAAAMRAVRDHDRRITREDAGQQVARDHRFVRAAEMAFARYERAVDKGFTMARYNLARALAEGRGTERDPARAARNFGMVAVTGNVPAMLRLADLHLAGVGVKKDRIEALALYIVAASIGSKGAERAKTMLSAHLGLDRVEQARERAKKLREQMPPLDLIQQQEKEQELLEAAAEGDEERIEDLLRQGVDANAVDAIGRTAIINAAWRGHEHIVRMLVEAGVEIDAADDQDRTPLAWASINGYGEISRDLLAEAALVDVRDRDGLTPLIRAAWNGHVEIVDALVKNEADVHAADDRGMTALDRARAQNERAIINVLRTAGARY